MGRRIVLIVEFYNQVICSDICDRPPFIDSCGLVSFLLRTFSVVTLEKLFHQMVVGATVICEESVSRISCAEHENQESGASRAELKSKYV